MIRLLPLAAVACLLASCIEQDQHGLPSKVVFDQAGGERVYTCDAQITGVSVGDYNGDGTGGDIDDNDSITCTYRRLTVKAKKWSNRVTLRAEPKEGGGKRTLYICGLRPRGGGDQGEAAW